jgi:hypothetical protein
VKMTFRQVVVRAASAAGLLVGSSLAACSGSDETPSPGPGVSGSTTTAGSTTGGSAAGGTGGAAAGGTAGGATGGTAGTGGGSACPGNQIMKDGACACPAYAPKYCEAITKCVSDQKDPDNCGACGNACGMMNACAAGVCTPNLETFGELTGCGTLQLLVANGKLYALSTMTGDFNAITLPAGGAATKVGTVAGGTAFTVDATNAYIAAGKSVMRLPLAGGAAVAVVTEAGDVKDVAIDGAKLYYTSNKDIKQVDATASAGTGTSVAQSADEGVAEGLAVAGGLVLYASNGAYNLESDPIAGEGHVGRLAVWLDFRSPQRPGGRHQRLLDEQLAAVGGVRRHRSPGEGHRPAHRRQEGHCLRGRRHQKDGVHRRGGQEPGEVHVRSRRQR